LPVVLITIRLLVVAPVLSGRGGRAASKHPHSQR
jgi:hypothetical protein